jgi:Mg2+-importing ATPase
MVLSAGRVVRRAATDSDPGDLFWARTADALAAALSASLDGLGTPEARARLARYGANRIGGESYRPLLAIARRQLSSPLLLLLVFAAAAAMLSGEWIDAFIVVSIVVATVAISCSREYRAEQVVTALQADIRTLATVRRDGADVEIPIAEVVPGDVVVVSAGTLVPGDGVVIESADFFVSESALTGESYPVQKRPGVSAPETALRDRTSAVFLGTNVRSGTARCLIVRTGRRTEFGRIASHLAATPPETEFERGLRRFGYLMTSAMLMLVLLVFAAHMIRGRAPVETLLFSVALAVGLSPELLPAILSVNLARGASLMAQHGVVVRRLNAIENLGSMDVLCTDKTGTLTEGVVQLEGAYAPDGSAAPAVLATALANAVLESGIRSPLDDAIVAAAPTGGVLPGKLAEIPFDFTRRRSSVVVEHHGAARLITKGSLPRVLDACATLPDGRPIDAEVRAALVARHEAWAADGIRVLGIGTRELPMQPHYRRDVERDLTFAGFLTFLDHPKADARAAIEELQQLGVSIRMLTGDNRLVASHVAAMVGLRVDVVLTGREVEAMDSVMLRHAVEHVAVFAEVEPGQKERIIQVLRDGGHVVGFLGDGANDAPAMHAADTSLSVEHAVDVARETADFVLLRQHLDVIRRGIVEGRRTFANTLKYVLTTTSANLGNMVSMAVASLFLPFLPLLASQILLNNFLSDIPAIGVADDSVDPELVRRPERWDMRFIRRFMLEFGLLSSVFDSLTFGVLLLVFGAAPAVFRTAWFVESLLSELAVALLVRTRRPAIRSRPGALLLWLTIGTAILAVVLPYVPLVQVLGLVPLPVPLLLAIGAIVFAYVVATETLKGWFFRVAAR